MLKITQETHSLESPPQQRWAFAFEGMSRHGRLEAARAGYRKRIAVWRTDNSRARPAPNLWRSGPFNRGIQSVGARIELISPGVKLLELNTIGDGLSLCARQKLAL